MIFFPVFRFVKMTKDRSEERRSRFATSLSNERKIMINNGDNDNL